MRKKQESAAISVHESFLFYLLRHYFHYVYDLFTLCSREFSILPFKTLEDVDILEEQIANPEDLGKLVSPSPNILVFLRLGKLPNQSFSDQFSWKSGMDRPRQHKAYNAKSFG